MELTDEFTVPLTPERAWEVLADIERVVPCLPGARLTEIDGDDHKGEVRVRVGPINATYQGVARFLERDAAAGRAVLRAEGSDSRQGGASATLTATLTPDGDGTKVVVVTDLDVAGKLAQFGRGVLADVSAKLLDQFAECLKAELEAEPAAAEPPADEEPSPAVKEFAKAVVDAAPAEEEPGSAAGNGAGPRRVDAPDPVPVDLLSTAGAPLAKRLAPAGLVAAIVVLLLVWRRRR